MSPALVDIVGRTQKLELDCDFDGDGDIHTDGTYDVTFDSVSIRLQEVLMRAPKLKTLTLEDMAREATFSRLAPAIKNMKHLTHLSIRTEYAGNTMIRHLGDIVASNTHIVYFDFPDLIPWVIFNRQNPIIFPDTFAQILLPALASRSNLESLGVMLGLIPSDAPLYAQVLKNNPTLVELSIDYSTYESFHKHNRDIGADINETLKACSGMSKLTSININIRDANKSTPQLISELGKNNKNIKSLTLGEIDLSSPESIHTASEIIMKSKNLTWLNISFLEKPKVKSKSTNITSIQNFFEILMAGISSCSHLQHFSIYNLDLGEISATTYLSAIEKLVQLKTITQNILNLPVSALPRLNQAMAQWKSLRDFEFISEFTQDNLIYISPGLSSLQSIESISLRSSIPADSNTAVALALVCLPLPNLKKIHVGWEWQLLSTQKAMLTSMFAEKDVQFSHG